jgi:hypothetical protein
MERCPKTAMNLSRIGRGNGTPGSGERKMPPGPGALGPVPWRHSQRRVAAPGTTGAARYLWFILALFLISQCLLDQPVLADFASAAFVYLPCLLIARLLG